MKKIIQKILYLTREVKLIIRVNKWRITKNIKNDNNFSHVQQTEDFGGAEDTSIWDKESDIDSSIEVTLPKVNHDVDTWSIDKKLLCGT